MNRAIHVFDLFSCVNNLTSIIRNNVSVNIITYITHGILSYASYSFTINAAYAINNGYSFEAKTNFVIPSMKPNTSDARWMKIALLIDSMEKSHLETQSFKNFVWIDADLAILDFNMKIIQIVDAYPQADIIMSKDIQKAPFVSNSGLIIVRNTEWARRFLRIWWNSYDKNRCCDQNAFTWLYDRDYPFDIKEKVALLPVNALNTDFPCWKTHLKGNQVLHLAGLTSLYRNNVMLRGYKELCRAVNHHRDSGNVLDIRPQLGLTRNALINELQLLNYRRFKALSEMLVLLDHEYNYYYLQNYDFLSNNITSAYFELQKYSQRLSKHRSHMLDYLKFDDDEKVNPYVSSHLLPKIRDHEIKIRVSIFEQHYRILHFTISQSIKHWSSKVEIFLYENAVEFISNGFELILTLQGLASNEKEDKHMHSYFDKIKYVISSVLLHSHSTASLHNKVTVRFLYYNFKWHRLLAANYRRSSFSTTKGSSVTNGRSTPDSSSNVEASINALSKAAEIWLEMDRFGFYGTDYVQADPFKEIAG